MIEYKTIPCQSQFFYYYMVNILRNTVTLLILSRF